MQQPSPLPKPRSYSPSRSTAKLNVKPIIKESPSKGSCSSGGSSGIEDFTSRYEYLLPKAPVVVLESPQLAEMLNYRGLDRQLLEAEICDFDINVESGIPFSGSVRVERKWKQMQESAPIDCAPREASEVDEKRDSEVRDVTNDPVLMTELVPHTETIDSGVLTNVDGRLEEALEKIVGPQ